jgi:non-homologous end joining protein Ku
LRLGLLYQDHPFAAAESDAVAEMILERRAGHFDPSTFRDRYQEALGELIEAKMRGLPVKAKASMRLTTGRGVSVSCWPDLLGRTECDERHAAARRND